MTRSPDLLYRHDGTKYRRAERALCARCGLEFLAIVNEIRKGGGKFCSQKCQRSHQALVNAAANRTVGLTASQRKKLWLEKAAPEVTLAHRQVNKAIAAGTLIRMPCEVCGNPKVDAHHDDYQSPLNVRWLCRSHHLQHHRK